MSNISLPCQVKKISTCWKVCENPTQIRLDFDKRHEQGAAFMAAIYGRLTGRAGVCMATLGPGATNLVTPAAYAHLGAFPMVMITGQKPILKSKQGQFQIIDVVQVCSNRSAKCRIRSYMAIPSLRTGARSLSDFTRRTARCRIARAARRHRRRKKPRRKPPISRLNAAMPEHASFTRFNSRRAVYQARQTSSLVLIGAGCQSQGCTPHPA